MLTDMSFKNTNELPLALKVEDVSELLQISRVTAYNLVNSADFPSLRIGKRITIPKEAFILWIESNTNNQNHTEGDHTDGTRNRKRK